MRLQRGAPEVGHEPHLEAREGAEDVDRLLVEVPRHAVAVAAVQARVRGEQAEGGPALVEVGRGGLLEAGDVVAPESEAREREREAAADGLLHPGVGREAVAAPVHGEALAARGRRACEDRRLAAPALALQQLEYGAVVELRVEVVHLRRVGAVEPRGVERDALAEVGLHAVHAHVEQRAELVLVPPLRVGVREVDDREARLPEVPLPDVAVPPVQEVALLEPLVEERGGLRDVGVDPHADPEPAVVEPAQQTARVGERGGVPEEVRPVERPHPAAVEVEDRERDAAVAHAVDEREHGLLVVFRSGSAGRPSSDV